MSLSNRYAEVLAFEAAGPWKYAGRKEAVIRERFDVSATRYYQLLNHVIDLPAALAFDPTTVRRLQRIRAGRRSVRQTGFEMPS